MKIRLVAAVQAVEFKGDKLSAADCAYLSRWAEDSADDPIWEKILADARDYDQLPRQSMHSQFIEYALRVRRMAVSMKSGDDPYLRESQERRAKLLSLAEKADDLARYFQEAEKYSGIAML
jgi:hypothetical protein